MVTWFKKNWQISLLIVVSFLLVKEKLLLLSPSSSNRFRGVGEMAVSSPSFDGIAQSIMPIPGSPAPPSDSPDRLVITTSSLSLLVKNVSVVIAQIQTAAENLGGFLINSHLSQPESAATGSISVRVPQDKVATAMDTFKEFSVKVVSQSVTGRDVTDQFQDLKARLDILNKAKAKYEQILDQATAVGDLLSVQRELTNLQSQIDSVKGQQKYLEQSAQLSQITIYLSTDELSLPYAPDQAWRPQVVFKTAVRALISNFRSLGSLIIWAAVYLPLIIPLIFLFRFINKKQQK